MIPGQSRCSNLITATSELVCYPLRPFPHKEDDCPVTVNLPGSSPPGSGKKYEDEGEELSPSTYQDSPPLRVACWDAVLSRQGCLAEEGHSGERKVSLSVRATSRESQPPEKAGSFLSQARASCRGSWGSAWRCEP